MKLKLLLALFSLLSVAAAAQSEIKEYKAKDNIYLVGDRVFSLYYITSNGVIVIDPINDRIAEETYKSIRKHTKLPIKYVIYSHNHWDHNGGGAIYQKEAAKFLIHEEAAKNLAVNNNVVKPDSLWTGSDATLKVGKQTIELTFFGKNHGDGMTIFRFPESSTLFTVDLVVPDRVLYAYLPDAKPKQWLERLCQMQKIDFETLLMAHVRPIGTRKDLDIQIKYFEDLYAATDKAMNDGIPLFEIPTKVKMPQYQNMLYYKEWLHMNVWRILMEKSIGQ